MHEGDICHEQKRCHHFLWIFLSGAQSVHRLQLDGHGGLFAAGRFLHRPRLGAVSGGRRLESRFFLGVPSISILSRDPSFENLRKPRENGQFLERPMVEQNGESTPRLLGGNSLLWLAGKGNQNDLPNFGDLLMARVCTCTHIDDFCESVPSACMSSLESHCVASEVLKMLGCT